MPLPTLGRPAFRRSGIVENLRTRIIGGEWEPGTQLPTLRDLAARHGASFLTVQQAVARLAQEGFVEARQGRGVFVSTTLPHRDHYLVLGQALADDERDNKFCDALNRAATELEREQGWRLSIWHPDVKAPEETHLQVEERLRARRLAGLIFQGAFLHRYLPLATRQGIPLAAFSMPRVDHAGIEGVGYVWLDFRDFFRKALDRLRDEGCRRVGCLSIAGTLPGGAAWGPDDLLREAAQRGLRMDPHWIQYSAVWGPDYARNLTRLWMSVPRAERPDGLIIADDNLVEDATRGVADSEARVPRDLRVIAHTNFQSPARSVVPVTWLGFDEKELLSRAVGYLQAASRGETPPRHHPIPARFENDPAPARPPRKAGRAANLPSSR